MARQPEVGAEVRDEVSALVRQVAREAAAARSSGIGAVRDGPEGPTTEMDLWAEKRLATELSEIVAGYVIAEEGHRTLVVPSDTDLWTWVVDPIDGTSSYIAGANTWGVQVGLCSAGTPVGGWIDCPDLGWHLAATAQAPLVIIGVDAPLGSERLVMGEGDFDPAHRSWLERAGVDRRGTLSCAVDYAQLAAGHLDAVVFRRTHPWDHVPGAYLVAAAGGGVRRWDGSAYRPDVPGEGILAWRAGLGPHIAGALLPPP